jgi:hypothetical protein
MRVIGLSWALRSVSGSHHDVVKEMVNMPSSLHFMPRWSDYWLPWTVTVDEVNHSSGKLGLVRYDRRSKISYIFKALEGNHFYQCLATPFWREMNQSCYVQ